MSGAKPRAREGHLAADHSKRGRRLVTLLDPESLSVTVLEPWEHAILVLCDGTRDAEAIAELIPPSADEEPIDAEAVGRCFKFFERQRLIHPEGLRSPGRLQEAYREWHAEPVQTGKHQDLAPPSFIPSGTWVAPGLDPTVALPSEGAEPGRASVSVGKTLVLAGAEPLDRPEPDSELLERRDALDDLLAEVDHAVAEADAIDAEVRHRASRRAGAVPVMAFEGRPPESGVHRRPARGIEIDEAASGPKSLPPPEPGVRRARRSPRGPSRGK